MDVLTSARLGAWIRARAPEGARRAHDQPQPPVRSAGPSDRVGAPTRSAVSARCQTGEALEDLPPAGVHRATQALRSLAEALEVAVLEVDSRLLEAERGEPHLDFGHERRVVLEIRTELPGQHETPRGIPLQHLPPLARRAVLAELVPAAVDLRLDHAVLQLGRADVVLLWPPGSHLRGEHAECAFDRGLDDQLLADGHHESVSFSAAAWKAVRARSHKRSR